MLDSIHYLIQISYLKSQLKLKKSRLLEHTHKILTKGIQ